MRAKNRIPFFLIPLYRGATLSIQSIALYVAAKRVHLDWRNSNGRIVKAPAAPRAPTYSRTSARKVFAINERAVGAAKDSR